MPRKAKHSRPRTKFVDFLGNPLRRGAHAWGGKLPFSKCGGVGCVCACESSCHDAPSDGPWNGPREGCSHYLAFEVPASWQQGDPFPQEADEFYGDHYAMTKHEIDRSELDALRAEGKALKDRVASLERCMKTEKQCVLFGNAPAPTPAPVPAPKPRIMFGADGIYEENGIICHLRGCRPATDDEIWADCRRTMGLDDAEKICEAVGIRFDTHLHVTLDAAWRRLHAKHSEAP